MDIYEMAARAGRSAAARLEKALEGKGVRRANQDLFAALRVLSREGRCTAPVVDDRGLVVLSDDQRTALGLDQ